MGVVMANSRTAFTKVPGLLWVGMGALFFPGPGPGKLPRLHSPAPRPFAQLSSGSGARCLHPQGLLSASLTTEWQETV